MSSNNDDEKWVKEAMSNDDMVANLLLHIHHTPILPPKPVLKPLHTWTVRQPRSKSLTIINKNKKPSAHRASPTTPLSWSLSATSEDSTPPFKLSHLPTSSSKVSTEIEKAALKRTRKKKSLAELRDEENSLLKERRDLKREMVALRMNLDRQRAANENLKRMKIEVGPCLDRGMTFSPEESISGQLQQTFVASITPITPPISALNLKQCAKVASESKFILPDLNMPFDEEPNCDVVCGVS